MSAGGYADVPAEALGTPRVEPLARGGTGGEVCGIGGGEWGRRRGVRASAAVRARQWLREMNLEFRMLLIEVCVCVCVRARVCVCVCVCVCVSE